MLTLSDLLLPPESELATSIVSALDEQGVALTGGGAPSFSAASWRLMAGSLAKQLPGLLEIGVTDVFVGAWNKSLDVREQIDKSLKSPGKDVFLQLAEHTIKSAHTPYVALMKNGREITRLSFGVDIELGLQGVVAHGENFTLTTGETVTGELLASSANDAGVKIKIGEGERG